MRQRYRVEFMGRYTERTFASKKDAILVASSYQWRAQVFDLAAKMVVYRNNPATIKPNWLYS